MEHFLSAPTNAQLDHFVTEVVSKIKGSFLLGNNNTTVKNIGTRQFFYLDLLVKQKRTVKLIKGRQKPLQQNHGQGYSPNKQLHDY
jgi:hypothetical protein